MVIGLTSLLLFGCLFALLFIGVPVSFSLLTTGVVFAISLWGIGHLYVVVGALFGSMTSQIYLAIPLFILMGNILAHTGIADELFEALHLWTARVRGGLAMGTISAGTVLGAMCGSSEAGTVTVGIMALPAMLKRGYRSTLAIGSIAAGGLLGFLIPPSVLAIVYAALSGVSLGKLYFASMIPGLLLAGLYLAYIAVRANLNHDLCPRVDDEDIPTWGERLRATRKVILPILIIVLVLGGIYSGATTPTEAAGVGCASAFVVATLKRRLTWKSAVDAVRGTVGFLGMIAWVIMSVTVFTNVYNALGAPKIVASMVHLFPAGGLSVIVAMMAAIFILGMVMDDLALLFLTMPIFVPIIKQLGFDPVWYGVLILINMQCALLTPPYGFNLFYVRAITPREIGTATIYKGVLPFILLQLVAMGIIILFPDLALWLPSVLTTK